MQPLLARQVAQCRAISHPDLVEDVRQVCPHRTRGNVEARADLLVAETAGDVLQDLELAARKAIEARVTA